MTIKKERHASPLDVAAAPFQFLPNDAEERYAGQGSEWQDVAGLFNLDPRAGFNPQWLAAIYGEKDRIFALGYFDLDDRVLVHNDRAIGQDMGANRRDHEGAG